MKEKRWVNRGFLHLPLLPLYGSGALIMLFASLPFRGNLILIYLSGVIGATLLELVVGLGMEAIFKVKYWDYSGQKWNYKGVICLKSSLFWGVLTIFLTEAAHKPLERLVLGMPFILLAALDGVIGTAFVYDTVISVKAALDFAKVLSSLEKAKAELEIQLQDAYEQLGERMDDAAQAIHERLDLLRQSMEEKAEDRTEAFEQKLDEWWSARGVERKRREENPGFQNVREKAKIVHHQMEELFQRAHEASSGMLKRNPTVSSKRYHDSIVMLKKQAASRREMLRMQRKKEKEEKEK
ncbi:putative ABC transporter permease [Hominifimenecus sp. rT4P-3]|uniref:putative ABC transporter permease n=1 Tax=Hominifimenecus sp. rT4P-3 TaxID=3242979 RepID=UPI003DA59224